MNIAETLARPALPPRLRTVAAAIFAIAVILVAVLSVVYGGQATPGRFDLRVAYKILSYDVNKTFARHLASVGGPAAITVLTVGLIIALVALQRTRIALVGLISVPLAIVLTEWVLKPIVGRTSNIYATVYSFPSGHTTSIFAVAFVAVLALCDRARPRADAVVSAGLALVFLVFAGCVSVAQVYTGRHFATDLLGGFGVALATVIAIAFAVDYAVDRFGRRSSPSTH